MTTPGSPGTSPRRPAGTPSTAAGRLQDLPASPGDQLDRFLAAAAARRGQHTRTMAERPADWADPDPAAALRLPAGAHPVARALGSYKEGKSRDGLAGRMRQGCERLQGREPRSLTTEDLLAYPWHHLTVDAAAEYRRAVYAQYRVQGSRNEAVCAVRAVVRQCCKAGLISPLRRDLLLEELYTVAPGPSSKRRRLTQDEINQLLAACESTGTAQAQARNTAIVALFRTSGMRIGELTGIELADWDRTADTIRLRETKNGRDHLVYLHPDVLPYLERWLAVRGQAPGTLFSALDSPRPRTVTPTSLRYMLQSRARVAGVDPFGSHDFRRTFATELLRHHDVALVGKLLNHRKVSSTLIYDLSGEEEQRAAVARLALPAPEGQAPREVPQPDRETGGRVA